MSKLWIVLVPLVLALTTIIFVYTLLGDQSLPVLFCMAIGAIWYTKCG